MKQGKFTAEIVPPFVGGKLVVFPVTHGRNE
jgi:hypothetical protein